MIESKMSADNVFGFLDGSVDSPRIYNPQLIENIPPSTMLHALKEELKHSSSFVFSVAFITSRGLALLKQALLDYKGTGIIITSRYLDFNDPVVFRELLLLENVEARILELPNGGFHAKGYIFNSDIGVTAIVGSSNLTDNALLVNREWNLKFSAEQDGDITYQLDSAVRAQLDASAPLTEEWIDLYEATRRVQRSAAIAEVADNVEIAPQTRILPNAMQIEALDSLRSIKQSGESRAVIVSATGTGKTILAALAVAEAQPQRMLFVAHREQILDKAKAEFQKVLQLPKSEFGKFVGSTRQLDRRFVFATVQSLSRPDVLIDIPRDLFDYVIIDEVHRSGADSYRSLVAHLNPAFLLGLTATPERTDGFNVFELFDYNVPYEIRLQKALEENMLVPFHYYGVTDFVNAENETVDDTSQLQHLVAKERVSYVIQTIEKYGLPEGTKGLVFCSRKEEACQLSEMFNQRSAFGKKLRTRALTGEDSIQNRQETVDALEAGLLDYIFTVDIFNEGIDIPQVNQIIMLRGTQSSIIFTQQLGRGLRKAPGKDHLRVIDFIGNYSNNFLIPIALYGDNSRNKDNLRRRMVDPENDGTISGVSSVNFDKIAQRRILDSLAKARLAGKAQLKQDIIQLQDRLNSIPALMDFARFNTVDPEVIATYDKNYWTLLYSLKFVDRLPSPQESGYLTFLSSEILNGKRPHELLVLKALLEKGSLTYPEIRSVLSEAGTTFDDETIAGVRRVLDFSFYPSADVKRFGSNPLVEGKETLLLSEAFSKFYYASKPAKSEFDPTSFRNHVDDLLETGLYLARHRHSWQGELIVGERYSRKDFCRLFNWEKNNQSTIYGYKVDTYSSTCPIFVTYHKVDVAASVSYEDEFVAPNILHWFTRGNRTLKSEEVQAIVTNRVPLHVFVKKDDAEGLDFYYLGTATSQNEQQQTMPANNGGTQPVVSLDLVLESPVEDGLYKYLRGEVSD